MRVAPPAGPSGRSFLPFALTTCSLGLLLLALDARRGSAQEESPVDRGELVTDRPDVTESASIVAPGLFQIETGVFLDDPEGEPRSLTLPTTLVRIGLSRIVEARVAWTGWTDVEEDGGGAGDAELGVKIGLRGQGTGADLSLLASAIVPVGEEPLGAEVVIPRVKGIGAFDLAPRLGLGVNAGMALPEDDAGDSRVTLLSWSSALGIEITETFGSFLEYFGEKLENEPVGHALDGGLTLLVSPDVQLDVSAGAVIGGAAERWFTAAGVSFRFDP